MKKEQVKSKDGTTEGGREKQGARAGRSVEIQEHSWSGSEGCREMHRQGKRASMGRRKNVGGQRSEEVRVCSKLCEGRHEREEK